MGFVSIIMFLLKYGPSIFQLIKTAVELIRWLKKNDESSAKTFAYEAPVKEQLNDMAKRAKATKDHKELLEYIERLKQRKAEVEFKQRNI